MDLQTNTKHRFIKDFSLPIQVIQEPMFMYYIDELDSYYSTIKKLQYLKDAINLLGSEDKVFSEFSKIKDSLIAAVTEQKKYQELSVDSLEQYTVKNGVTQKNIYSLENSNKVFISIDLKHANFNVLKMYDSSLVLESENYEDFVGTMTDVEYFKKSKYIRQFIFGNLLPKKQQKLQHWVIDSIVQVLLSSGLKLPEFNSASADEIVIHVDKNRVDDVFNHIKNELKTNVKTCGFYEWLKIEMFVLKSIGGKSYFVKENMLDGSIEFKAIPSFIFMQVYKKYVGNPVEYFDRIFFHEGYLAEFKQPVFSEG